MSDLLLQTTYHLFPIDGPPPIPIGVPTLNSHSFSTVSLSSAKIITDGINGVLAGELGPSDDFDLY
jgi:hypothetical protein